MGVVLSTNSTLAPISFAGSIIGFISFAFTLATFFRVVWTNLETFMEPQHAVHTALNNLREELIEERASLKVLKRVNKHRRKSRKHLPEPMKELFDIELDEVTIKTMSDTVRYLMREFEQLERPFLEDGEDGILQARRKGFRRGGDMSPSPHYEHSAYASPPHEKRTRGNGRATHDDSDDDNIFWAQRVHYAPYTMKRRLDWLYNKAKSQYLFTSLTRIQTRRVARQVNSMTLLLRTCGECDMHTTESLDRIEDRLNHVVGVRRIE